jgi:hypothetical protein
MGGVGGILGAYLGRAIGGAGKDRGPTSLGGRSG